MFRSKTCPFCNSLIASKVIIHKLRGEHFFEQKLRFGLVLGRMAMQNKNKIWEDYEQLLRAFFNVFRGKKKIICSPRDLCIMTLIVSSKSSRDNNHYLFGRYVPNTDL